MGESVKVQVSREGCYRKCHTSKLYSINKHDYMREQRGDGPLSVFFLTHFIFKVTPTFFICELFFFFKVTRTFLFVTSYFFNVSQIFQKIHKDKSRSYFE